MDVDLTALREKLKHSAHLKQ